MEISERTIVQASDLKTQLDRLGLNRKEVTIASVYAEAMCPSIKYQLVPDSVEWFAWQLDEQDRETVPSCLEFIKFGMGNMLITFDGIYDLYDGGLSLKERSHNWWI